MAEREVKNEFDWDSIHRSLLIFNNTTHISDLLSERVVMPIYPTAVIIWHKVEYEGNTRENQSFF